MGILGLPPQSPNVVQPCITSVVFTNAPDCPAHNRRFGIFSTGSPGKSATKTKVVISPVASGYEHVAARPQSKMRKDRSGEAAFSNSLIKASHASSIFFTAANAIIQP